MLDTNKWKNLTVKTRQLHKNAARNLGVMVIVEGYGHGDTSSNPRPDWLNFT